jgi:hypothetical protein
MPAEQLKFGICGHFIGAIFWIQKSRMDQNESFIKKDGMTTEPENNLTPNEYLETHDLTRQLKCLGVTTEQLQGMRFRGTNEGWPFDQWSFTWGSIPPDAIHYVKPYCALKWLVHENPPFSRDKEAALRLVAEALATPTFAIGESTRNAQSKRAKKLRGRITCGGKTIGEVIEDLAAKPQYLRSPAKDLWPHLGALLDEEDLDPMIKNPTDPQKLAYEYDFHEGRTRKQITFRRFQNIVSRTRRRSKSR